MQLKKFLVIVDAKRKNQPALVRAAWLAKKLSATLDILLVEYESFFDSFSLFNEKTKNQLLSDKQQWLDNLVQPLRDEGLVVKTIVRWNKLFYKEILAVADELKPDIIFKSAYSETMLKRLFITSSSWQLIRNCTYPLWLAQHDSWEGSTLCAALDPLHVSDKPAYLDNELIKISEALSRTLALKANYLHSYAAVSQSQLFGTEQSEDYKRYLVDFSQTHKDAFEKLLANYPKIAKNQQFLLKGLAEEIIPEFVKQHKVGLMIMGAVARDSLDNLLIGHTAERVLELIECDLLVVHPKKADS